MQYFPSRVAAGNMIADELEEKYRYENCAVLALGDGAVLVGTAIAQRLHCVINMLLIEPIQLPREINVVATINNFGGVTYNDEFSAGELEEIQAEYFGYIEQQKLEKLFAMNRLIGSGGTVDQNQLKGQMVIVVSDGLTNGFSMRAAAEFLKPICIEKLIMVTPFASVSAADQMHMLADEIICLNVLEDIISIDHYYDDAVVPSHSKIIEIIEKIILRWQ